MLIHNLILGLIISLPLTAIALDNMSEQSITHSSNSSMPASAQSEQQMQSSSDNRDAIVKDPQEALKTQLKISGEVQEIAWNDFIKAVNDRLETTKKAVLQLIQETSNNKLTIVDVMQKRVDIAKVDYDLLIKQQAALNDLYASLDDEQRTNANTLLRDLILERRQGHHRYGPSPTINNSK